MDHAKDLKVLLEYSDYDAETLKIVKEEIEILYQIYPELIPSKGWGEGDSHNVGLTGKVPVTWENGVRYVPFSICFPLHYPRNPPWCRVVSGTLEIINPSENVDLTGRVLISLLRKWSPNHDSLEVIQKCTEYFSTHFPVFDFGTTFLSEMWRVRMQIDALLKEKILLEKHSVEVAKELEKVHTSLSESAKIKILEEIEEKKSWIAENKKKNLKVHERVEYQTIYHQRLFETIAEEESAEDLSKKLTEAYFSQSFPAAEFFTRLKQVYNDKFMLMKKKEKLLSLFE